MAIPTSSTLVETVSLNYEDFSESFLTCGTCLCMYDGGEHTPKLLSCSHTVCKNCLERIVISTGARDAGSFRCPICRETIPLPRGGGSVAALPPSFLVNQLLDLMTNQRRDIIPKCSTHSNEELLFCETCDAVFCRSCTAHARPPSPTAEKKGGEVVNTNQHTIIPFAVAIKRMSEILQYKAQQCVEKLDAASESISNEMVALEERANEVERQIDESFEKIRHLVEGRRQSLLEACQRLKEEKRRRLQDQLEIIAEEKDRVRNEYGAIEYQVDVRTITKKIADLNNKIVSVQALAEPRENAYLRFDNTTLPVWATAGGPNSSTTTSTSEADALPFDRIERAIRSYGEVFTSKTFPSLCTLTVMPQEGEYASNGGKSSACSKNLRQCVQLNTVDFNGTLQCRGGDPVAATLKDPSGSDIPTTVEDTEDGSYMIRFTPRSVGIHKLFVSVLGRPVKEYPLCVEVVEEIEPCFVFGSTGSGEKNFKQPTGVACYFNGGGKDELCGSSNSENDDDEMGMVYVLDTANERIRCLTTDLTPIGDLEGDGLEERACTGIVLSDDGNCLYLVNWRTKYITQWQRQVSTTTTGAPPAVGRNNQTGGHQSSDDDDDEETEEVSMMAVRRFTHAQLQEPTAIAVNARREIFVADTAQKCVFHFDKTGRLIRRLGKEQICPKAKQFTPLCLCVGPRGELVIGDNVVYVVSLVDTTTVGGGASNANSPTHHHYNNSATPHGIVSVREIAFEQKGRCLGLALDGARSCLLVSRACRESNTILCVDFATGAVQNTIRSVNSPLQRGADLAVLPGGHVIAVDLDADCLRLYRYV